MNAVEFHRLVRRAVVYYAVDAPEYTATMDELVKACDQEEDQEEGDRKWDMVLEALHEVDEFMADSDAGTLCQKEQIFAEREGRKNRYPGALETDEEVREAKIATLKREFRSRGIAFREDNEACAGGSCS